MLKRLFTSNTRIKLLTLFLTHQEEEFFIRELTRKLDEQINSIRRELDNLKKAGILKAKIKNRKKYYHVNKDCEILEELKNIILKAMSTDKLVAQEIEKMGDIKVLALSGVFAEKPTTTVDMLIVGDIDKDRFHRYLSEDLRTKRPVKFTIMTEDDYKYRLNIRDKFVTDTLNDPDSKVLIKKI